MGYSLGKNLENYVATQVEGGLYNNASEVVRDALRLHEEHNLKLAALRAEVQAGLDDLHAGRISHAGPDAIKRKALTQKAAG